MSKLLTLGVGGGASGLLTGLAEYWKLDEAAGAARVGSHAALSLADTNTVGQAVGKLGNAAQFTAASVQRLSVADLAALSMGDIDFTVACWVYLDSKAANRTLVSKFLGTTNNREYFLDYDTPSDRFRGGVSGDGVNTTVVSAATFGSPATATWYFLLLDHDAAGNTIGISVNNGTRDSAAHSAGCFDGAAGFILGGRDDGTINPHNGRLDGVGVWKRLLSASEKAALYNGGAGLEYPFS